MIEGLKPTDKFSHRMEYGQMWHACEEALAAKKDWLTALKVYVAGLAKRYPMDQEQIAHWFNVCRIQFPHYITYWAKHPDVKDRRPVEQEKVFKVAYKLPSGRTVYLRGKRDAADIIGKGKSAGLYLQENKTKSDIDEQELRRQLTYDLQTMIYLVTLEHEKYSAPIKGVRYNVVRRPLSGGKGSIVRSEGTKGAKCGKCKGEGKHPNKGIGPWPLVKCLKCNGAGRIGAKPAETWEAFYKRAEQYIIDAPETYFMRWTVEVSTKDIERFRRETLDPILEQLCTWYDCMTYAHRYGLNPFSFANIDRDAFGQWIVVHYRHPFGCVNTIDEYGWTEVDSYLQTGSEVGLRRVDKLFGELQ